MTHKGFADMPILAIILLMTVMLFIFLAFKQDGLETRSTQLQAEVMAIKGSYELLTDSLHATWKQVATDVMLNASAERFGLPLYWYRYNSSAAAWPALPAAGAGCAVGYPLPANPAICWADDIFVGNVLTTAMITIELPNKINTTVNIGRISSTTQQIELASSDKSLALAADRATASVKQSIKMTGGATSIDAATNIVVDVPTQLKLLQQAAIAAVGNASVIRAQTLNTQTNWIQVLTGDVWKANVRAKQLSALSAQLTNLLTGVQNLLKPLTISAAMQTTIQWTFVSPVLRLEYDAGMNMTEGHHRRLQLPLDRTVDELKIVGCFGDRRCSGGLPATILGDEFYNGIDILAQENEAVYSADGGMVDSTYTTCSPNTDCPAGGMFAGLGNYVMIRHRDVNGEYYYSFYGHLNSVIVEPGQFIAGNQRIGTAGKTGAVQMPLLHVRVMKSDKTFVNPCLYFGCSPATPIALATTTMPKPTVFSSAEEYANFLTKKNAAVVSVGDDFCSPSDRFYRSSALGYGFYSDDPSFDVWPVFGGTVERIEEDAPWNEGGCGETVYVDSGDFVTVYSGIFVYGLTTGDKVGPWTIIGRVDDRERYCPNPHLTVVFAEPSFVLRNYTDHCGKQVDCRQGFTPISCNVNATCRPIGDVPLGVPEQYCAAIEWPIVSNTSGLLWMYTQNAFERKPTELNFRMADSFPVLDCSEPENDKKRFTWLNNKDLLCYNNTLYTCGPEFEIPGAEYVPPIERCIGGTGSDCSGGYICASDVVLGVPTGSDPDLSVAQIALTDRTISKFCGSPANDTGINDTATDWICCTWRGKQLNCPQNSWQFTNGELICEEDAACV